MYFEDAGSDCLPFKLLKDSVRALVSSVAHERRGLRFIQTLGGTCLFVVFQSFSGTFFPYFLPIGVKYSFNIATPEEWY